MKRLILIVAGLLLGVTLIAYLRPPRVPEAPAARVKRATIVQALATNGKVEALDSFAMPAQAPLVIKALKVREGDSVRRGQVLAVADDTQAREALGRAKAQLEVARADRGLIERGGTSAELAELNATIARTRLEKEMAEADVAALQRLVEKQAAARAELDAEQERLRKAEIELAGLERKRRSFIGPEDRERVLARIREAEVGVAQAETALRFTEIRSPADGVLFSLALRPGGFYNTGELLGQVGVLDKVRVRVLVDEPDLGSVQAGQPVRITWDGLPGKSWEGQVERLPSAVQMVGTRSVGEVLCTIDSPERRLLPNMTVNVEIRTGVAENALAIPREAVVRDAKQTFVLMVDADHMVVRQPVRLGLRDLHRVEVLEGLKENQVVLLPGDRVMTPGQKVQPKMA